MKLFTRVLALGVFGVICGIVPTPASATPIPEVSYLPVEEPLDVGGTILEPGVYVIRVLPSDSNRNLLQITNEDRTIIFATVLSVPHALPASDEMRDTKFVFFPASNGAPRALRTWFNGETTSDGGHDIVYPERRAMQIAAVVKEPVVAYKNETVTEELKTTPLEIVTPEQAIATYVEPAPQKVAGMSEGAGMPRTAGSGPLLSALGLLALVVAASLRVFRAV